MPHHTRFRSFAAAVLIAVFWAAPCRAQFFDDFDGDALAPHWAMEPAPGTIAHHVSGGMMHVTNVLFPSMPKIPTNSAHIRATFTPVAGDFVARATLGWDPGQSGRHMTFTISNNRTLIAQMSYSEPGMSGFITFSTGGPTQSFPAPAEGMHEFMMVRHAGEGGGAVVSAYLNGELLSTSPTTVLGPATATVLHFSIPFPNNGMQPLHVDRIQIVPSPGAPGVLLACVLAAARRRRRAARTKETQ